MFKKMMCLSIVIVSFLILGITNRVLGTEKGFPTKSIELICPWGAGGATSTGGRIIAGTLQEILGVPVVVINKPGGGGTVGTLSVCRAKPDGYTLLTAVLGNMAVLPNIRSVEYGYTDFELLVSYADNPHLLVVKSDAPWKTLEELIAGAKKEPGKFKFSSPGVSASGQFIMELFKSELGGLKIDHVPFKSGPEAVTAVLGGHVHMAFLGYADMKGVVDAGRVRVLATGTEKRFELEGYPTIPTFTELGYPGVKLTVFHGIAAPKGLPKEVSNKLQDALYKAANHPEVIKMLRHLGFEPFFKKQEEFTNFVSEENKKVKRIAKEAGIRLD